MGVSCSNIEGAPAILYGRVNPQSVRIESGLLHMELETATAALSQGAIASLVGKMRPVIRVLNIAGRGLPCQARTRGASGNLHAIRTRSSNAPGPRGMSPTDTTRLSPRRPVSGSYHGMRASVLSRVRVAGPRGQGPAATQATPSPRGMRGVRPCRKGR